MKSQPVPDSADRSARFDLPEMPPSEKLRGVHEVISAAPVAVTDLPRLQVRAKFFFEGENKFYLQGVTYGPFRPRSRGGRGRK